MLIFCDKCKSSNVIRYASGEDKFGEFEEFECRECFTISKRYIVFL